MALDSSPLAAAMAANGTEERAQPFPPGADAWLARLAELPLTWLRLALGRRAGPRTA